MGVWKQFEVTIPPILEYNMYMNGVDRSDQLLQCYEILRKTKMYWKTMFFHLCWFGCGKFIYSLQSSFACLRSTEDFTETILRNSGPRIMLFCWRRVVHFSWATSKIHCSCTASTYHCWSSWKAILWCMQEIEAASYVYKISVSEQYFCFEEERNCFKFWHSSLADPFRDI